MFAQLFFKVYRTRLKMLPVQVSIIVIGNWNPRIFTPTWIKENLFCLTDETEIEGLVNFEDMDFAFKHEGIVIVPKFSSVEINFEGYDEKKASLASSIISRILELLPQTPIKAMGVNIRYKLSKTENIKLVKAINELRLNFEEFRVNQLRQTLQKENYQLNIVSEIFADIIVSNFNFHYQRLIPLDTGFINNHFTETQNLLKNGN